jgi:hypothetical protein
MPEGVSHKGVFGEVGSETVQVAAASAMLINQVQVEARTGTAASRGQLPQMSAGPIRSQPKARSKKDTSTGSAGGVGSGSGSGMGPGNGRGVGPGRGYNMGGGSPRLGGGDAPRALSPEEQQRRELLAKMNPSIAAIIDRLKNKNTQPGSDETRFVRNGKADLQVWLAEKSAETLAQLKRLGFEIVLEPKTTKMIIGRLPIEKLAALAELKSVRYIAPMLSN